MAPKMGKLNEIICRETKDHYYVGIDPTAFLDEFMPWNETTPIAYRQMAPSKARIAFLKSVPPVPGQFESTMYKPFVKALDRYITDEMLRSANIEEPQTLRFLNSLRADLSCEKLNVDVSTYWSRDLPRRTKFSHQQTHEEFKPSLIYDAFQHDLDEPRVAKEADKGDAEEGSIADEDDNKRRSNDEADLESESGRNVEKLEEAKEDEEEEDSAEPEGIQPILHSEALEDQNYRFVGDNLPKATPINSHETDTEHGINTRGQITAYAGLALSMNFRRHFFSMLILGRFARFIRWDRRGAIVTHRFDYTKRPRLIFEFYRRYGQLSLIQRGFDPTATRRILTAAYKKAFGKYRDIYGGGDFSIQPSKSLTGDDCFHIVVKDNVSGVEETFVVPPPRYVHGCLMPFKRGTKRSLACLYLGDKTPGAMFFIKDSWQEESSRTVREADIYRKLKAANVQYVASMRLGGDVNHMVTVSQDWLDVKFRRMVCHRLVLETVAESLSTFTWCKVLLSCIADAVEGAQQAYKAGILHRDLSAGNIMIVRNMKTKEWNGVLIDWDMCILWQEQKGKARSGRIGTWPFISTNILTNQNPSHSLCDDIESAFWVLLYHALLYTKHDLKPVSLYQTLQRIFSPVVEENNGSILGGQGKISILSFCLLDSTDHIAEFEVVGFNDLLADLGTIFSHRYLGKNRTLSIDLDDPDVKWFPNLLREKAMKMDPLAVTPRALKSPTNDSKPPENQDEWQRASTKLPVDFFTMAWVTEPGASERIHNDEFRSITSSLFNHLTDELTPRKRSRLDDLNDHEGESAPKVQRLEGMTSQKGEEH